MGAPGSSQSFELFSYWTTTFLSQIQVGLLHLQQKDSELKREKGSVYKHDWIPDRPEERLPGGEEGAGDTVVGDCPQKYHAGNAKRKSHVNPIASIKRQRNDQEHSVLSLSFAAGVKVLPI